MKIAIAGGGPGAIFAYFAALDAGFTLSEVTLFAQKLTYPVGAFWLYELPHTIEGIEPLEITMQLQGQASIYTQKQWGTIYTSSAEKWKNGGTVKGFDPILLHVFFQEAKKYHLARPLDAMDIERMADEYDYVIQTFPTDPQVKSFSQQYRFPVYFAQLNGSWRGENYCNYSGLWIDDWTRLTIAFNNISIEYPSSYNRLISVIKAQNDETFGTKGTVALMPDLHPETEPISKTVVGDRENILLTGRWTTLNRSHLAHHTREDVLKFFRSKELNRGPLYQDQPNPQFQALDA